MNIQRRCPFCGRENPVYDTTTPQRREAGLVYLRMDCPPCRVRIEAVGSGEDDAVRMLDLKIGRRKGTKVEDWRIVPRQERRRAKR